MNYDVNYFIRKFERVPENKWFTGWLRNDDNTKRCALGHCCPEHDKKYFELGKGQNEQTKALVSLFVSNRMGVATVNDGNDERYPQLSPKQRILAALQDIKKMQEKDTDIGNEQPQPIPEKTKERIRYVSVPETINQQSKELILS